MEKIPDKLEQYILDHIDAEPQYLQQITRDTYAHMLYPRMLSGHLQGRILKILCHMIKPERVLEIGTFTGYSALCMAEALTNEATIDTIELNDELESFIQQNIALSEFGSKIKLYIGDALDLIPNLEYSYDLIFIDGNKRYYPEYYHLSKSKLNKGGFIIADNVLWSGKVVKTLKDKDLQTAGIVKFNEIVANDRSVEKVIFPVRDGFTIIRKL